MTAEIVPFRRPCRASTLVGGASLGDTATPKPANVLSLVEATTDAPSNGVAVAALALLAACREMTASLALLSAHCTSADGIMREIGNGAVAIAHDGEAISQSAALLHADTAAHVSQLAGAE